MGGSSILARFKDRSFQSFLIWVISLIIVIIVISITRTPGALVACIIIAILAFEFNFFNRYAKYSTFTIATFITVTLAYFMALSTMLLLPLDLGSSIIDRNDGSPSSNEDHVSVFLIFWNLLYWGMFVLNNLLFKLQLIYDSAGHLTFSKKIMWTLKQFVRQIIILLIIFAIACIIIAAAFKINGYKALQGAILILINVYGLLVLTFLLGYGLVQFPWFIWTLSYPDYLLKCELSKSDEIFKKYREAQVELNEAALTYQHVIEKIPKGHELYGYVQYLKDELPKLENLSTSFARTVGNEIKEKGKKDQKLDLKALEKIDENVLAAARTQLKLKTYNLEKYESKWNKHCDFVFSISNLDLANQSQENKEKLITNSVIAKVMPIPSILFYRLFGFLFFLFSMLIIFSETTLVFGAHDDVLAFSKIVKSSGQDSLFLLLVILILVFLAYFVFCAYFALFRMEVGLTFDLTVHQTQAITMMRGSTVCLNLAFPLCYNLMMLFNEISPQTVNGNEYSSAFVEFFKPMRAVPFFGDNYNTIVPLFIALIGFFTVFKFFGRLLARATKGLISIDVNENTPDKIAKGEKAVLAEWERRKRKLRQEEINTQRSERAISERKAKDESLRSESILSTSKISEMIPEKSNKAIEKAKEPENFDIENNPKLTEEQKEEIMKQESISQEIMKDLEFTADKNPKGAEFEEIKGLLAKKNKIGQWKQWYFCVVGNSFCYYENSKLNKKEGEFEIGKIKSVTVMISKKKKNKGKKFSLNLEKGAMVLKAKNSEEAQKWVNYLSYVVNMYQINNI